MESMSNAPYLLDKARAGFRMGHGKVTDHMFQEGLEDAETGLSMGVLAQDMADKKNYTREQQDEYAIRSLNRAVEAIQNGYFKNEIVPVTVHSRKGDVIVDQDEQPLNAKVDKISSLRPAFKKDGTITAANAELYFKWRICSGDYIRCGCGRAWLKTACKSCGIRDTFTTSF